MIQVNRNNTEGRNLTKTNNRGPHFMANDDTYLGLLSMQRSFVREITRKNTEMNEGKHLHQEEEKCLSSSANCILSDNVDKIGNFDCSTLVTIDSSLPREAQDIISKLDTKINKNMCKFDGSQIRDQPWKGAGITLKQIKANSFQPKLDDLNVILGSEIVPNDASSVTESELSDEEDLIKLLADTSMESVQKGLDYSSDKSSCSHLQHSSSFSEETDDWEPIDCYKESPNANFLVSQKAGLEKAMEKTLKSQSDLQLWDRQMGLKRCHSKTMTKSTHSRKKLRALMGHLK